MYLLSMKLLELSLRFKKDEKLKPSDDNVAKLARIFRKEMEGHAVTSFPAPEPAETSDIKNIKQ